MVGRIFVWSLILFRLKLIKQDFLSWHFGLQYVTNKAFFEIDMFFYRQNISFIIIATAILLVVSAIFSKELYAEFTPSQYKSNAEKSVGVDEHLSEKLDLNLVFTNEKGKFHSLLCLQTISLFCSHSVLFLQYALQRSIKWGAGWSQELDWIPGREFRMLTVSIDPEETAELARARRKTYLDSLEKSRLGFLGWKRAADQNLGDSLGFDMHMILARNSLHIQRFLLISGDGSFLAIYMDWQYSARDIKFSLIETTRGVLEALLVIMSCFSLQLSAIYTHRIWDAFRWCFFITCYCHFFVDYVAPWNQESHV